MKTQFKISEVKITYQTRIKSSQRLQIKTSLEAFKIIFDHWDKDSIEHFEEFKLVLLNRANKVLGIASISKGGVSGTVVDVRIILQYVIKANASGFIIAHNHPSGKLEPSNADKEITGKIKSAASLLNVDLLDHIIIIPEERYYSFSDEGIL